LDVRSAIKELDEVDDDKAEETIRRIEEDEKSVSGFVDGSVFNETEVKEEVVEEDDE
ncbi:portal protein, partial [Bacillus licheniformis]|nr:portal protein [Bacillus licheniformis]